VVETTRKRGNHWILQTALTHSTRLGQLTVEQPKTLSPGNAATSVQSDVPKGYAVAQRIDEYRRPSSLSIVAAFAKSVLS
jgi:hypothetical protein